MLSNYCKEYRIDDHIRLTIIEIESLDEELERILDGSFVSICEGESDTPLSTVKRRVSSLFSTKSVDWIMGATAEFFVHLYIRFNGYKQECLYLNLEENSIKKGFDGYYSNSGNEWIMESKAGAIKSAHVSHSNKVALAMRDLESKVAGKDTKNGNKQNNPWQEAYSHASQIDVGAAESIRKNIKKLANEYTEGLFHKIEEFNTMPCGTVFLDGTWLPYDHSKIKHNIVDLKAVLKGKNVHVICVTQISTKLFQEYVQKGV